MKKMLLSAAFAVSVLCAHSLHAQTTMYGITSANSIFTMANVSTPTVISGPYTVSGVAAGQLLVGLDSRPSNGALYALGYDSVTGTAQLYTITSSGVTYTANAVGSTTTAINLSGTNNVAFDFISTTANQIRIIGRNGNNYVMNADNGSMISTGISGLSYAATDLHSGAANSLAATAFTNSFYGADATTEVGFDAMNNVLVTFDTATFTNAFNNTSTRIHSIGAGTTGAVFTAGSSFGMDTWYDTITHNNTLYLAGNTLLGTHLFSHDLSSPLGTLTDMGAIGTGSVSMRDIAFATVRDSTAAVIGHVVTALSLNLRNLVFFDAANPNVISKVRSLSGMTAGQSMIGIDYSPATGELYGLGYNSTAQTYQLYTIDSTTGHVTAVTTSPQSLTLGTDNGSGNYINAGFRFIPTLSNTIRVTGNNGNVNARISAATGMISAADTALSYVTGDVSFGAGANLSSIAYTGYNGDASTQMFGFDANTGGMVMFDQTNSTGGAGMGSSGYINTDISLNTILSLLLHNTAYNNAYMSIMYDAGAAANVGYMVANYDGDSSGQQNYSIVYNMTGMLTTYHKGTVTATPTKIGNVGYGTPVKDAVVKRVGSTTGIYAVAGNTTNDLLVYPNPTASNARIVLNTLPASVVNVDVIDMNGYVARSYQYAAGTYNIDVDMSTLPTGIYSVRVFGKDVDFHNLKVVKQ